METNKTNFFNGKWRLMIKRLCEKIIVKLVGARKECERGVVIPKTFLTIEESIESKPIAEKQEKP